MDLSPLRLALVQLCSTPDLDANRAQATHLIRRAADAGAVLITTPENTPFLGPDRALLPLAQPLDGPFVSHFQALALELGVWLLIGSVPEQSSDPERLHNTSVLISPDGAIAAHYRKLHLFDVTTPDGQSLHESATVAPGDALVTARIGPWTLGLSICYDLRFPEMYRALVDRGADLLLVPSAFTAETGRDHWHALLRARAIENQAFIVAPNQHGHHCRGRHSYGRSVVFDPWGTALATCPDRPSFAVVDLDHQRLLDLRARFPALTHRRSMPQR